MGTLCVRVVPVKAPRSLAVALAVALSRLHIPAELLRLNLPDVNLPDVNLPDVNLPDVNLPDVNLSDLYLPYLDLNLPDVSDRGVIAVEGVLRSTASDVQFVIKTTAGSVRYCPARKVHFGESSRSWICGD